MWPFKKETSEPVVTPVSDNAVEPMKIQVAHKITLLTATLTKKGDQWGISVESIAELDINQQMRSDTIAAVERWIKAMKQIPPAPSAEEGEQNAETI
jgi:hypothetical protein